MTDATVDQNRSGMHGAILRLATSRGIAITVSFVAAPILARLFSPDAYGALGILGTIVSVLAAFSSLSYVSAIPIAKSAAERRDLCVLCLLLAVLTSVILGLVSWFGADLLAATFDEPDLAKYAPFLPLMLFGDSVRNLLDTTLSCDRRFGAVAIRNVLEVVVTRVAQFGAHFAGLMGSPLALILGALIGSYVSAIAAGFGSFRQSLNAVRQPLCLSSLRATAVAHRKFPLVLLWSQTLNAITLGLPALILGLRFPMEVVGLYGMAYTMVSLPVQLFTASANRVFYVEAGHHVVRGESAAGKTQQLVRVLATLTSFPLTVVLLLGPLIFEVFLGANWREAGVYAQILAPWISAMAFASPLLVGYMVFGRQGEALLWNVILLGGRFFALYFGGLFFGVRSTLGFFSAVSVLILARLIFRQLHLFGVSRRWGLITIVRAYATSFALLAPVFAAYWLFDARLVGLVALAGACAAYGVLLHHRYPSIVRSALVRMQRWASRRVTPG